MVLRLFQVRQTMLLSCSAGPSLESIVMTLAYDLPFRVGFSHSGKRLLQCIHDGSERGVFDVIRRDEHESKLRCSCTRLTKRI